MFGGSGGGFFSKGKSKSKSKYWTKDQQGVSTRVGNFLGSQFTKDPTTGLFQMQGLQKYGGKLGGTYTAPGQTSLFKAADAYAKGEDSGPLMQHYDYFKNPEERVSERVELHKQLMQPEWEKQDSLRRSKMKSMGLQHSSDMLKKEDDVARTRQAEIGLMANDLRDKYEQLGFQVGEQALQRVSDISNMQYEITNKGLDAEFQEWIRTQPEYNPMLDNMLAYLGLQGKATSSGATTQWGASGSGGGSTII